MSFSELLDYLLGEYGIAKFIVLVIVTLALLYYFRRHYLKIISVVALSILGFLILFPKSELSDFVSKKVSEQSQNRAGLDFDDLSFTSSLGLEMDNVYFEMAGFSPLNLKQVIASPELMALIRKKPYGRVNITGLFRGEAEITVSKYKPEADGAEIKEEQSTIAVSANRLDLAHLKSFLNLPFELNGKADLNAKILSVMQLVPQVSEDGKPLPHVPFQLLGIPEVSMTIKNFDMPAFLLEKGMLMPIPLPALKFSEVVLKGRLYENTFQIQELQLGRASDDLSGTVTGKLTLTKGPLPQLQSYEVTTNLKFNQSFHDRIGMFLSLIRPELIRPFPGGYEFKSKVSGAMFGAPTFNPAQ